VAPTIQTLFYFYHTELSLEFQILIKKFMQIKLGKVKKAKASKLDNWLKP